MTTPTNRRKLGRLAPHNPQTHPRLQIGRFLTAAYPTAPATVDYISAVDSWPMYLNDSLGDCTVAAAGHMIETWTRYGAGTVVEITDTDVLTAYESVSGYRPGQPSTDGGAVMQDVLSYWRKTGIGGHRILAFAEINVRNAAELKAAMALFGHVYLGINFPAIAMDQFDDGQPWDAVRNDGGIEGGHAIDWGYCSDGRNHKVVTWGAVQQMTPAFFSKYVEEAWVVVSPEWIDAAGQNPEGLDVTALGEAFSAMTGEPSPFPVQPPTPAPGPVPPRPTPGPAPVADPDAALMTALDPWAEKHHTGFNAAAARAYVTWRHAKDL